MSAQVEIIERPAVSVSYQDYSTERKTEVLALLDANKGSLKLTSQQTGIHHATIDYWNTNRHRFTEIQTKTADLAQIAEDNARNLGLSILNQDLSEVPLNHRATAFGIMVDKMQLLRGQPTSITVDINSHDLASILQGALSELTGNIIDVTPVNEEQNPSSDAG